MVAFATVVLEIDADAAGGAAVAVVTAAEIASANRPADKDTSAGTVVASA